MNDIPEGATHKSENGVYYKKIGGRWFFYDNDNKEFELSEFHNEANLTPIKQDKEMNTEIDWDCEKATGKNYALYCRFHNICYFYYGKPSIVDGDAWDVEEGIGVPAYPDFKLHERPKQSVYTQEMHDDDINPPIGSRVVYNLGKFAQCENKEYKLTKVGEEMTAVAIVGDSLACLVSDDRKFSDTVNSRHFKPIDQRTQAEKDKDEAVESLKSSHRAHQWTEKEFFEDVFAEIKKGNIKHITFTGAE